MHQLKQDLPLTMEAPGMKIHVARMMEQLT